MGIMQTESKFISIFFSLQQHLCIKKKGVPSAVGFHALKNQNNNYT